MTCALACTWKSVGLFSNKKKVTDCTGKFVDDARMTQSSYKYTVSTVCGREGMSELSGFVYCKGP